MIHKLSSMSLWDCPGECLSFPQSWQDMLLIFDENNFLKLWKAECAKRCHCSYDSTETEDGNCIGCNTERSLSEHHKQPILTMLQSCDVSSNKDEFVCLEGYYFSNEIKTCIKCAQTSGSTCGHGLYFERCQKNEELHCLPCTNPIPNETSQVYGSYSVTESCLFSSEPFHYINEIPSCALYMTPTWDDYRCSFECKANFIDIGGGGGEVTNAEPRCVPCYEACSVGEYCRGGSSKTCQPCYGFLGENMVWLPDTSIYDTPCRPACAPGFYKSKNNNQKCIPCLQNQKCSNSSEIFLGCTDVNPGACQAPNLVCTAGQTYLYYQVYSLQAECRPCSAPQLGLTYILSNCSTKEDTVLRACQASCPSGFFKVKNCTLTGDIVCQRCSNPINMNGLQMIDTCGGYKDYTFAPCPSGYACDGTPNLYQCPWPMLTDQGLCKCPHGTYLRGEKCSVVQCQKGQYPHGDTGTCIPCTQNSNHSITLEGVWGQDACACEEGYFIERKNGTIQPIQCWPCGDLSCIHNVQYQTPCPGVFTKEPECLCKLPPGVETLDDTRCSFSLCKSEWDKTGMFDPMASLAPRVWNENFWIADDDRHSVVLLEEDSSLSSITSIAVILKDTLVYVLNHTSLWIASRNKEDDAWTKGIISNDLFIVGFRNNTNNILLDIMVSNDVQTSRFWLSFVMMSTFCGDISYENGERLTLCSNIELIEIKENSDNSVCLSIPNTKLCAENMYKRWNNNIDSGIPWTRIHSVTMDYATPTLYMAISHEDLSHTTFKVYSYSVYYYDDTMPSEQKKKNSIATMEIKGDFTSISNLVWANDHLFALLNDSHFAPLTENYYLGIQKAVHFFSMHSKVSLHQLKLGPRSNMLLALSSHAIYEIDLVNGFVIERYTSMGKLFIIANSENIFSVSKENKSINAHLDSISTLCDLDHMSFSKQKCTLMPCLLLKDACGPNSVRTAGSTDCKCMPGYFLDSSSRQCQKCRNNYFCKGNNDFTPCPSNSNSQEGSTSITQCFCNKGFYKFKQNLCLPCPKGFWCLGQLSPPIRCTSGSNTLTTGAQSPIECQCQARTQGTDCSPCASTDVCLLLSQQPRISALYLSGYGPWNADTILNGSCLNWGVSVVYALPAPYLKLGKFWSWVIVSEPLPSNANDENLLSNISSCMTLAGFIIQDQMIYTRMTLASNVQRATPCGLNLEWSGESSGQPCTCVAGYEKVTNPSNQFRWCSPCAKGTIRVKQAPGSCVPCHDNNSHAPWLGMDHCICKEGYYMDHAEQKCTRENQPAYGFLASPFLVIPLTITLIILCFLGLWFVSFISV